MSTASLPTRERELKRRVRDRERRVGGVAPHAGARIETVNGARRPQQHPVAPHAGARIETVAVIRVS